MFQRNQCWKNMNQESNLNKPQGISFQRNSVRIIHVGMSSMEAQILAYIIVSSLERSLLNIVTLANI